MGELIHKRCTQDSLQGKSESPIWVKVHRQDPLINPELRDIDIGPDVLLSGVHPITLVSRLLKDDEFGGFVKQLVDYTLTEGGNGYTA
jgi:hypothetical protein